MDVINIGRGKGKGKSNGAASEGGKPRLVDLYANLADVIDGRHERVGLPPFPRRWGVLEPEPGARIPVVVCAGDVIVHLKKEALIVEALQYGCANEGVAPDYVLTPRQAKEAVDFYLSVAKPLEPQKIAVTRWADEPGLTYTRLPWRYELGDAPTWGELLERMTNARAFCEWVGSIFVDASSLQSYVWIHGHGNDGKGAINRFLKRVFGPAYRSKQPPNGKFPDKFWTYGLLGARLVVFPDCENSGFTTSGVFKSLTGGDPLDVEAKGQMSFTATIAAKYLILSNLKPEISSSRADMRRIIYCELGEAAGFDPAFEDRLWAEGGAFLSICVGAYLNNYPDHRPVSAPAEEISDIVSTIEEAKEVVFDKWFALEPAGHVIPLDMQKILNIEWPRRRAPQLEFLRWLERTHGIRKKTVRLPGDVLTKRYTGMCTKQAPHSFDVASWHDEN